MATGIAAGQKQRSTKSTLADYVPRELRQLEDPQRDLPRIAKDQKLTRLIESALQEIPTRHELYCADARRTKLLRPESVHLVLFPKAEASVIDKSLEQRMDYAQRISSLVRSLRKREKLRVRQPLQKILLPVLDASFQTQVEGVKDLILAEVNVKDIEYVDDASGVIKKKAKPNFKRLGKRLGRHMKAANQAISAMTNADIAAVEKAGGYTLEVDGERYELTLDDFEITTEDIPGWFVASDGPLTVALDVTVTPALRAEGMARELVNRIQNIRKDKDFNVTDRILVRLERHDAVTPAIEQFGEYIKNEVLAERLELIDAAPNGETIELPDDVVVGIAVERS